MVTYMKKNERRMGLYISVIAACIFLLPRDAFAWGPVVHLHSAMQLLSGAAAVAPALLDLLKNHSHDFLYGTLAADFIIGKKHAKYIDHCHNWDVARSLLREARAEGSHREAFMYGYLNHLGADVVAHNHTVPQMMVIHFEAKGLGHIYWEARADWRMLTYHPELEDTWASLAGHNFSGHDRFLWNHLSPTLFSNKVSAGIYRGNLVVQRNRVWRNLLRRIDRTSKLRFDQDQLLLWIDLAAQSGARAADNPWSKRLDHLDPIGIEALSWAFDSRRKLRFELRRHGRTGHLDDALKSALAKPKTVDIHHFEEDWE
jgi:hypothetical protein